MLAGVKSAGLLLSSHNCSKMNRNLAGIFNDPILSAKSDSLELVEFIQLLDAFFCCILDRFLDSIVGSILVQTFCHILCI